MAVITGTSTVVSVVVIVIGIITFFLHSRLGLGKKFTENEVFHSLKPILKDTYLEIVAELPYPPGNVAVSSGGRVFFSFHPEYDPPVKVAELIPLELSISRDFKPFPSELMDNVVDVTSVLSLRIDHSHNRLYLLDFGFHGLKSIPALVGYQLADPTSSDSRDKFFQHHVFPASVAGVGSMLNDFQISPDGSFIIIVDTSIVAYTPAIIVYSVETQVSYRVLSGIKQLYGASALMTIPIAPSAAFDVDNNVESIIDAAETKSVHEETSAPTPTSSVQFPNLGPIGMKVHADSVALSRDGETLFFGALTGDVMFGLPVEELLQVTIHSASAATAPLGSGVVVSEEVSKNLTKTMSAVAISIGSSTHNMAAKTKFRRKPITDGLTSDLDGNIFFTACEHNSIGVLKLDRKEADSNTNGKKRRYNFRMMNLVQSPSLLRWPDGFSFGGPAGSNGLYITNSALHLKFQHHGHKNLTEAMRAYAPFHILKVPQKLLDKYFYGAPNDFSVVSKLSGQ